jgi:hypothetical protein
LAVFKRDDMRTVSFLSFKLARENHHPHSGARMIAHHIADRALAKSACEVIQATLRNASVAMGGGKPIA